MMLCGLVQTSGKKNYFRKNDEGDEVEARYVIEDTKLSSLKNDGNRGHDIGARNMYVTSIGIARGRLTSDSEKDLWGLSDPEAKSQSTSSDDVSLAESFIAHVGRKYNRASKKSQRSLPNTDSDSSKSEKSPASPKKNHKSFFRKFCRRSTKSKTVPRPKNNKSITPAGSELSLSEKSDNEMLVLRNLSVINDPPQTILTKPRRDISSRQEQPAAEAHELHTNVIERVSPDPPDFQHLKGGSYRNIEEKMDKIVTLGFDTPNNKNYGHTYTSEYSMSEAQSYPNEYKANTLVNMDYPSDTSIKMLAESHDQETTLTDISVYQDSTPRLRVRCIDEVNGGQETYPLLDGDNDQLTEKIKLSEGGNIQPVNNNVDKPQTCLAMGDLDKEAKKDENTPINKEATETQNKTEYAEDVVDRERDQQWANLLESIRNLDRDKLTQTKHRKRQPLKSSADIKQRRNAFIKGLGLSQDYITVMESDANY